MLCVSHHVCSLCQSATFLIMAELQLLQSLIYPASEKLCCSSPHCSYLHFVIIPAMLNHASFYNKVCKMTITENKCISVTMLNGHFLHWCVRCSLMTGQFLSSTQVCVHNFDNRRKTKGVVSTTAILKCQSLVVVLSLPTRPSCSGLVLFCSRHNAMLQSQHSAGQDTPLPKHPWKQVSVAFESGSVTHSPPGMLWCWHPCRKVDKQHKLN